MNNLYKILFFTCLLFAFTKGSTYAMGNDSTRTLIIFFDGLRPDYITREYMPHLYELKRKGSYGNNHHSVFPTVTRVNSASYATGSYPGTHGLLGNSVYFPEVDKTKGYDAGDAKNLLKITEATSDKLLTSTSLGEVLSAAGINFMVFSSGTTGQAFLQNHKVNKGAVINPELILPESMKVEVERTIGTPPPYSRPNTARHIWTTDALLKYGLVDDGPLVNAIWLSDPDGSAHAEGIGSPTAIESLKVVDSQLGRILQHIEKSSFKDNVNILFSTDHGFVTHVGTQSLSEFLVKEGLKKDKESEDVIVVGGAIYVKDQNQSKIKEIVVSLQSQEWVGAVFTKSKSPNNLKGMVEGTLSFDAVHWNHKRSGDILVDVNWDNRKNDYGYEGTSFNRGVAGHGSSSPYEIQIPFIAYGPGFKKAYQNKTPTSNVDLVPTVLALYKLQIPSEMDGRPIKEVFEGAAEVSEKEVKKQSTTTKVNHSWGTYSLTIDESVFQNHRYVNFTKVERINKNLVKKGELKK